MDRYVDDMNLDGGGAGGGAATLGWRIVGGFGSNPGNLAMHLFVPGPNQRPRPLVVVLHGCTQDVATMDAASGWSRLATARDFLLLMPGQLPQNNAQTCFSWFQPTDNRRDSGEVLSIRQMIAWVAANYAVDPANTFICGLSAGGAMAGAMLASYPEVFAAGAIIAGLPYGTASNVVEAIESMQSGKIKEARTWGDAVRAAAPHNGPWPRVAIWHGTADPVVKPINAGELVKQWTNVHGVGAQIPAESHIGIATHRVWHDANGHACVSEYSVPGLGHGAPVDDVAPPAPFFLPAGLSSTRIIADDWGLTAPRRGPLSYLSAFLGSGPKT